LERQFLDPTPGGWLQRGKVVFLWGAVPMVFGIGVRQVYLSEEVFANAILTETLFRGRVKPDRQQEAKCLV
jgi:hypothetical protein